MHDSLIHAQLHRSGLGELLLLLAEATGESPQQYATLRGLTEASGMAERDVLEQLGKLRDADLAVRSERMVGGWRPTLEGRRLATDLRSSLEDGQLRVEHTMRAILRYLKSSGGEANRDDWSGWQLHEDGRTPVALEEREQALDLLEQANCVKSIDTLQASHVRVEITPRGRAALLRSDVLITDGMFEGASTTHVDQRIGIKAETFNNSGGAVQAGDHTVQNITINNAQVQRIEEAIESTRVVLERGDLDAAVREEVSALLDELEDATRQRTEPGLLHQILTKATMAAASTGGSAAGAALFQGLALIGNALTN